MSVILFQGDSITDCARNKNELYSLGVGYANLVSAELGYEHPNEYQFINKGISGNRIVDLYARIKADIINLKPDFMSILIGVNDVWHEISFQNGVDEAKFEKIYTMLIEEIYEALPDIKLMILEPYVLLGSATADTAERPDKWQTFDVETKKRAKVAKRIAEKFNIPFVSLQDKLDEATKLTGNTTYWTADGVHPTPFGHELIARAWLDAYRKYNS